MAKVKRVKHKDRGDGIPFDKTETLELEYFDRKTMHVSTYKGCITLHTPGEIVWLTANDAARLGRALLKSVALRRKIDAAEAALQRKTNRWQRTAARGR